MVENINKFEYDSSGYIKAKDYLEYIDKLEEFNNNMTSVDGYSLVNYANFWYNKIQWNKDRA